MLKAHSGHICNVYALIWRFVGWAYDANAVVFATTTGEHSMNHCLETL